MKVNVAELYTYLADNSTTKTGFVEWNVVLSSGQKVAGIYRGFGSKGIAVARAPKLREKGFRTLGPIESDRNGNLEVLD